MIYLSWTFLCVFFVCVCVFFCCLYCFCLVLVFVFYFSFFTAWLNYVSFLSDNLFTMSIFTSTSILTLPGWGGGDRKCPRWLSTLNTFLILKQTSWILLEFIWQRLFFLVKAIWRFQPYFDRLLFEILFSCIFNQYFSVFFVISAFSSWFLLVVDQFWRVFEVLEKSRNPRWRTNMAVAQKRWRNAHVMWRYQLILWTWKEIVLDVSQTQEWNNLSLPFKL